MKKVILIALIAAIAAGALLYFYLDDLEKESVVEVVYEDVLVASADIPAYSVITADMVTLTQMPEGTAHTQGPRIPRAKRSGL
jgi:Flp pilus assembly protein CpaB